MAKDPREKMYRGRKDRYVLQWYTAPRNGGHRQVLTIGQYESYHHQQVTYLEQMQKHGRLFHPAAWFFETIEELFEADRKEWSDSYLNKTTSESEKLLGVRFE